MAFAQCTVRTRGDSHYRYSMADSARQTPPESGRRQTWTEYRLESFGEPYEVWHDGPDFADLQHRWDADPITAERMLCAGIAEKDPLAAQSTAMISIPLRASERFVDVLTAAVDTGGASFRVRVAEALYRLTGDASWSAAIVRVIDEPAFFWGDRLDGSIALARFPPTAELIDALARGVRDPDYLVRYHSSNSLLRFAGGQGDIAEDARLFPLIVKEKAPDDWTLAAEELADAARQYRKIGNQPGL
jgi:hypothetical protein